MARESLGSSISAPACTSISKAGSKAASTPRPTLGALRPAASWRAVVNCSSNASSGRVVMRGEMNEPYKGPPNTMAGSAAMKP